MTAVRIVSGHNELSGSGELSHYALDNFVGSGSFLVVSGVNAPAAARTLVAGPGLIALDGGPGGLLQIQATPLLGTLTEDQHKTLRQLIHFIDDGPGDGFVLSPFKEVTGFPFETQVTWWETALKVRRIYQSEITRSDGWLPVTQSYKVFALDGITVAARATDVITYVSGCFETFRSRSFA